MTRKPYLALCVLFALMLNVSGAVGQGGGPSPQSASPQAALGTAFTYQGQLENGGNPVNGACDFQFGLWDAAALGTQSGVTQTVSSVTVNSGLFTVMLNGNSEFGGSAFDGSARYLQITVRCGSDSGFTPLSPWQALTPTPYALYAPNAGTAMTATTAWNLSGNSGTTTSNFIGTTDNMTLTLGVSNTAALRIVPGTYAPNLIGGYSGNVISNTLGGGVIAGGGASGYENRVWADFATVGGGDSNVASRGNATVGGGTTNTASGWSATVGGGFNNQAISGTATIAGGYSNVASGNNATVGGGWNNTASGYNATVGGGEGNTASEYFATVGGGVSNTASGFEATVAGGTTNTASDTSATVGGGNSNTASSANATVGGGWNNTASSFHATVGGGINNIASGWQAIIGGGGNNQASGDNAAIGGGYQNTASGFGSTIGGGTNNTASGPFATVPGGGGNVASGDWSFAVGQNANTNNQSGAFVWADSTGAVLSATIANQFLVRASGGITLYTDSGATTGVAVYPGSGTWNSASDRNLKSNFSPVDPVSVLNQVIALPIQTWNYTSQDASIHHIGPMAQDFYAAFNVGENNTSISTVDAQGVAFAAIQGLYQVVQAKDAQIANLQSQLDGQAKELRELKELVESKSQLPSPNSQNILWFIAGGMMSLVAFGLGRRGKGSGV